MKDLIFDYMADENHVERRERLSDVLRAKLHDPLPADTQYHGEAAFWLQVHEGLLRTSALLPNWCEQFLNEKTYDRLHLIAPRIASLANQLVQHAHTHHHIEDDHFFPVFLKAYPQLANPLDLLEKDHEILSIVLDDIEKANKELVMAASGSGVKSAHDSKSNLLQKVELLHIAAKRLDYLFMRHISDEEEICLPTLMRM